MLKSATAFGFIVLGMLAALVTSALPAAAQQNPFVGTWGTSLMLPNGAGYSAFVDFYPNGALHLSGVVTNGGQPVHLCGSYQFNQTTLITVFRSYSPKRCSMGICEGPPLPLNQPMTVTYQFPNPNELVTSDAHYVRQPSNPFPLPPTGCN
jgi:hypothetical protein